MFLIFYGFFRIVAEQYRVPDQQLGMILDFISMGFFLELINDNSWVHSNFF